MLLEFEVEAALLLAVQPSCLDSRVARQREAGEEGDRTQLGEILFFQLYSFKASFAPSFCMFGFKLYLAEVKPGLVDSFLCC